MLELKQVVKLLFLFCSQPRVQAGVVTRKAKNCTTNKQVGILSHKQYREVTHKLLKSQQTESQFHLVAMVFNLNFFLRFCTWRSFAAM